MKKIILLSLLGILLSQFGYSQCTITCLNPTINLNSGTSVTVLASTIATVGGSGCGFTQANFTLSCGQTSVTLTANDGGSNSATQTCSVTVSDNVAPNLSSCQDITVQLNGSGSASIATNDLTFTYSDNCDGNTPASTQLSQTSFSCSDVSSSVSVTLTARDANNNADDCNFNVTVEDNVAPTLTCNDLTVQLNQSNNTQATITAANVFSNYSDNCGGSVSNLSLNTTTFNCSDVGTPVTVTLTGDDTNGNQGSCTGQITVQDTENPVAVCISNNSIVNLDASGNIDPNDIDNGSSDNCSYIASLQTPVTCASVNTTVSVTLVVTDPSGNTASCTRSIQVRDNISPTANCVSGTLNVALDDSGLATINPQAQLDNGSTDNCFLIYEAFPSAFDCDDVGNTTVTLLITDPAGNTDFCTVNATVTDAGNPIALCEPDFSIVLENGQTSASVNLEAINDGSFDNCTGVTLQASQLTFGCADIPSTDVVLTVTDEFSNRSTCTTTVSVSEMVAPELRCVSDVQLTIGTNGSVTLDPASLDNTDIPSSDNCTANANLVFSASQTTFTCADEGITQITASVMDAAGNTSESSCIVFVQVVIPAIPTAVCNNTTIQLNASGNATLAPADINSTANDCGLATLSASQTAFTCSDLGPNNVTLTVTGSGGSSNCAAVVTVEDNIAPTAICNDLTVMLDGSGNGSITDAQLDGGSTDNCAVQTAVANLKTFDCTDVGQTVTSTLTVTDASNNTATCTGTITVVDQIDPTASCVGPLALSLTGTNNRITIDPNALNLNSSDNCTNITFSTSPVSLDCSNVGVNSVLLTVTDDSGNTASCTVDVTLSDDAAPTAVCQSVTVQLDETGNVTVAGSTLDGGSTDNCISNVTYSLSENTFDCTDVGNTIPVTLTVTDPSGNNATDNTACTITIEDGIAPTALCVANNTVTLNLDGSGMATLAGNQIDNGSTDNCNDIASLVPSQTTFTCDNLGTNEISLTVTDGSNNSASCTTRITVEDNVSPTAICQDITVALNSNGQALVGANEVDNGSSDNCAITSTTIDPFSFDCDDIGANTVTLTVRDATGNMDTEDCTITIEDQTAPTVLCKDDFRIGFIGGVANITGEDIDNGSFDNCGIDTYEVTPNQFVLADNGANMVTLTVTDINGNAESCTTEIFVGDITPPNAFCNNVSIQLDASGNVTLDPELVDDQSFDLNGIDSKSVTPNQFDCSDVGLNVVTLTVFDPGGNMASCDAVVRVEDNSAPTMLCQDITIALDNVGTASIVAADVDGGTTDNCSIDNIAVDITDFDCSNIGNNTVTFTATDVNNNVDSCDATVTIEDNEMPVAICQDITIELDDSGNASIEGADLDNSSTDNCSLTYAASQTDFDCSNVGPNIVTLTVTDQGGNMDTEDCTVTVEDNVLPQAICLNPTIELDDTGNITIDEDDVDGGSNDACGIANRSIDINNFDCNTTGINQVTLTVTDENGNSSECEANVNIVDVTDPIAICQDITVELDASGMVSITEGQIDDGSNDACGVALALFPYEFTCANVGSNTVQLEVTDPSGNVGSCFADVEVQDNILPTPNCQDLTVQLDGTGKVTITPEQLDDNSFDNCGIKNLVATQTTFSCEEVGDNTVTLTFTDDNDNKNTCDVTVTVEDPVMPDAVCRDITVEIAETGEATIAPVQINAGSNTNCQAQALSFSLDQTTFTCAEVGDNTVTMTVSDINGNMDDCTATVTVEDNTDPEAVCQDITVQLDAAGMISITADDVDGGSTDACGIAMKAIDVDNFDCDDIGDNRVILTVTDGTGNTDNCVATVTVEDNIPPTALCNDLTVQLDATGVGTITATDVDGGSTDNCAVADIEIDVDEFGCDNVGSNTVTLTVTDVNGNSSTCTGNITVEDNVAPEAVCQDITVELDALGEKTIVPSDVDGGSTDACGIKSLEIDIDMFGCDDVGGNTVTLTVTDNNDNTDQCTATVTVEDNIPPMAVCLDITIELDMLGMVDITADDIDGGSNDACGIMNLAASQTDFTCADVGDNTVTLTVTDNNGNVASCDATVTVEDNIPPVPVCNSFSITPEELPITITAEQIDGGSTDNCGIASISIDKTVFDCDDLGETIVTLTVTDVNGNSATCESTITLIESLDLPARYRSFSIDESIGTVYYESCGSPLGAKFTLESVKTNPFFNFRDDDGQFVYLSSSDDFRFTARVSRQDLETVAGLMIRPTLNERREVNYVAFNEVTTEIIEEVEFGYLDVSANAEPRIGYALNPDGSQYLTIERIGQNVKLFVGTKLVYETEFTTDQRLMLVGFYLTTRDKFPKKACFDDVTFTVLDSDSDFTATPIEFGQVEITPQLTAYPNPSNGNVNVNMSGYLGEFAQINIFNLNGQVVRSFKFDEVQTSIQTLDLSALKSGVYVLKVKSFGKEEELRLILQK